MNFGKRDFLRDKQLNFVKIPKCSARYTAWYILLSKFEITLLLHY